MAVRRLANLLLLVPQQSVFELFAKRCEHQAGFHVIHSVENLAVNFNTIKARSSLASILVIPIGSNLPKQGESIKGDPGSPTRPVCLLQLAHRNPL